MQDEGIVELYWKRDETAIRETEGKYGRYLTKIAYGILADQEDCCECVNDTYLKAWNSMPPHKPAILSTYLGKITRQTSIDRYRTQRREKRGGSEYEVSLSELEECLSHREDTEQTVELHLLTQAICAYLEGMQAESRIIFIGRYFYLDSVKEIAHYMGAGEAKVKSILHRTRKGLKAYLEQEGFIL